VIRRAAHTLSAIGIALLLVTAAGCATPTTAASADDGGCRTVAPDGASEAARAYADAVNAATPAWTAVSDTLVGRGHTHRRDLRSQINADTPFVEALEAIDFPPEAAQQGAELIAAVRAYDEFLKTTYRAYGFPSDQPEDNARLNETRAQSSSHLRDALGLPGSTCFLTRP